MSMNIGFRLKQIRKEKGFKQHEVAEKIGLNIPSYNKIENDNRSLTISELKAITDLFDIDPRIILGKEEEDPIINYMRKHTELSEEAKRELNNVLFMIDDAYGQFKLHRGES